MSLSKPELETVLRCVDKVFDFRAERDRLRDLLAALEAENKGLAARVAELEARCKRLEEAGDALQSAVVGTEGMTHWQWLAAAHEADLRWRKAKEAKP